MIETYQPLRFYTSANYQLRVKQGKFNFNPIMSLVVDKQHLLPFCIRRTKYAETQAEQANAINLIIAKVINIANNREYDIKLNLTIDYGFRGDSSLDENQVYEYALYRGQSTITSLPQGRYQIYLKDEELNEFYSEIFGIWFPQYTVKFEYRNSGGDLNDLWFYKGMYYKMEFESFMYSVGEYEGLVTSLADGWGHNKITRRRKDEIYACDIFTDSKIYGSLHAMQFCDTIYFTDESGQRYLIEITDLPIIDFSKGGHFNVSVKFRIIENMLISTPRNISWISTTEGESPVEEDKSLQIGGRKVKIGGKTINR